MRRLFREATRSDAKNTAEAAEKLWQCNVSLERCLEIYGSLEKQAFPCDKSGVFLWLTLSVSENSLADVIKDKAGYCPALFDAFRHEGRITDSPHVGDAVFLDVNGCALAEHCGVVVKVGKSYGNDRRRRECKFRNAGRRNRPKTQAEQHVSRIW